jgi:hypothetical protein
MARVPKMTSGPLTIPVLAALAVVSSTNQGPATMVIMLPTWDTPSAASSEKIPVWSATTGACLAGGVAARPPVLVPRPTLPPTKLRIAANASAASGCRDGTSS